MVPAAAFGLSGEVGPRKAKNNVNEQPSALHDLFDVSKNTDGATAGVRHAHNNP